VLHILAIWIRVHGTINRMIERGGTFDSAHNRLHLQFARDDVAAYPE
jgi:hypothetical protein